MPAYLLLLLLLLMKMTHEDDNTELTEDLIKERLQ